MRTQYNTCTRTSICHFPPGSLCQFGIVSRLRERVRGVSGSTPEINRYFHISRRGRRDDSSVYKLCRATSLSRAGTPARREAMKFLRLFRVVSQGWGGAHLGGGVRYGGRGRPGCRPAPLSGAVIASDRRLPPPTMCIIFNRLLQPETRTEDQSCLSAGAASTTLALH